MKIYLVTLVIYVEIYCAKAFNVDNDIVYELYTKEQPLDYQALKIAYGETIQTDTTFNPQRPTRIFIHGFLSKRKTFTKYAKAFLDNGDYNFIACNWLRGSSTYNYVKARGRVDSVGLAVAQFIDYLVQNGLNLRDLIVLGHSLGAHIAGIAGKNVQSGKIPIIVGLDPAKPLFSRKQLERRLTYTDAEYVQVIHTKTGQISISYPLGHADFYPNGGTVQPGCSDNLIGKCSHGRAHALYLESLYPNSSFLSIQCESYEEVSHKKCTQSGPNVLMGGDANQLRKARGIYYLETNEDAPYARDNFDNFSIEIIYSF